jgi:hypothetical protein
MFNILNHKRKANKNHTEIPSHSLPHKQTETYADEDVGGTAKLWNQPRYPTTEEWIKYGIHIPYRILLSH